MGEDIGPVADDRPDDGDEAQSGEGTRRRRGTRGGRGRGSRSEAESQTRQSGPGIDEPRIVGRRPGRPPAAEPEAEPEEEPAQPTPIASRRSSSRTAEQQPSRASTSRRTSTRTEEPSEDLAGRVAELASAVAEQNQQLRQLHDDFRALGEQVERSARQARLGVFVDVPNLLYGVERGERPLDMGKLLAYLSEGRDLVRATAYAPVSDNPLEPVQQQRFVAPFVPYEYRIVTKPLKRFADGSIKGNFDVEMAVDLLTMADRLDVIAMVSGDSDFARVVEEVQSKGVRVEVVSFAGSTSAEMRALADRYVEVGAIAHLLR
jgi:uncharacterized LabA/DUF88 family protein